MSPCAQSKSSCAHVECSCAHVQPPCAHAQTHCTHGQAPCTHGQCSCAHVQSTAVATESSGKLSVSKAPPTTFPPTTAGVVHTSASYDDQPIVKADCNSWTLCLPIKIPSELTNPTLTSLVYAIKYATTWDNGNATIQTDLVLSADSCPRGICEPADLKIYRKETGRGTRMVDDNAVCLSSVTAVKCNSGGAQWSHHVDRHCITPNARITQPSNLYLVFHVLEYAAAHTLRCLAVEVSASWLEETRKEGEEGKKKAEEAVKAGPVVADDETQKRIAEVGKKLGIVCPAGYAWHKTAEGYTCGGGTHTLTNKQLEMAELKK